MSTVMFHLRVCEEEKKYQSQKKFIYKYMCVCVILVRAKQDKNGKQHTMFCYMTGILYNMKH